MQTYIQRFLSSDSKENAKLSWELLLNILFSFGTHHEGASGVTKYVTNGMPKKFLGTALGW